MSDSTYDPDAEYFDTDVVGCNGEKVDTPDFLELKLPFSSGGEGSKFKVRTAADFVDLLDQIATRVNETTRSVHRLTRANVSIAAGMAQGIHSHIEATKNKEWSSAANVEFLQEFSSWPEHKRNERIKHLEMSPDAFEDYYSNKCKFFFYNKIVIIFIWYCLQNCNFVRMLQFYINDFLFFYFVVGLGKRNVRKRATRATPYNRPKTPNVSKPKVVKQLIDFPKPKRDNATGIKNFNMG